jgi:hypothetical protein
MQLAKQRNLIIITFKAALFYSLSVFFVGFLLGTVRVLILRRCLKDWAAVFVELPFILRASWYICQRCVLRWNIHTTKCLMGCAAFLFLQLMEICLGYTLANKTVHEYFQESLSTFAGSLGLLGQAFFGYMPMLVPTRHVGNVES